MIWEDANFWYFLTACVIFPCALIALKWFLSYANKHETERQEIQKRKNELLERIAVILEKINNEYTEI